MIYKKYEQLSGYLIAPDGTAIDLETKKSVLFENTSTGKTAKLITDEVPAFFKGKKKNLQLVRRFTREDLLKMYDKAKEVFEDTDGEIHYTTVVPASISKPEPPEAGKAVIEAFKEETASFNQLNLDQLKSAKRVVKSNPKAPKEVKEKVAKAIKEVDGIKGLKIPYFNIDGIDYQSARKASEALNISVNTVLKRAKQNKDGWFYIEELPDENTGKV